MTRDELIGLLEPPDPLRAARLVGVAPGGTITYSRDPAPLDWVVDGDHEQGLDIHQAAHAAGTPSEAAVFYGAGIPAAHTVDRLIALGALAGRTGLLRAVSPRPAEGNESRPGSWGVEDLVVIALARYVLPATTLVRPDWVHLGPAAAQIAVAFGANDWQVPASDPTDVLGLAHAVGRQAVAR